MEENCFAKRLREAMEASGLSQAGLSRASGIAKATICRYVSGDIAGPNAAQLAALTKALNVTPNELLGHANQKPVIKQERTQALEQIKNIADRAIFAADVVRDDMTRTSYTDEYVALAICFGELCGRVRLIRDIAAREMERLA